MAGGCQHIEHGNEITNLGRIEQCGFLDRRAGHTERLECAGREPK